MASKSKKTEGEVDEEPKAAKPAKAEKASKSIKAQKPEKVEKAEKKAAKEKEEAEKPAPKKDRTPARKLAGADTGAEAAAAESRQRAEEKPAEHRPSRARSEHAREYRPGEKYKVGETIFHPVWKEEGKVIEVGKTAANLDKIVVEFDRLGTKRLVANYSSQPQRAD